MKQFLMVRQVDSVILGCMWQQDESVGPLAKPNAPAPEGVGLVEWPSEFVRESYLDSYVAKYVDGEIVWVDTQELAIKVSEAIAGTYADIDKMYFDAVGNRAEEYKDAEADARAFAVSGFAGEPTANVSSFARRNPTGVVQSNQWAAEQIIARADAFAMAKIAMREQRFDTQAAMRESTTEASLAQVQHGWDMFISALRKQLGL